MAKGGSYTTILYDFSLQWCLERKCFASVCKFKLAVTADYFQFIRCVPTVYIHSARGVNLPGCLLCNFLSESTLNAPICLPRVELPKSCKPMFASFEVVFFLFYYIQYSVRGSRGYNNCTTLLNVSIGKKQSSNVVYSRRDIMGLCFVMSP